jgi:hypothetical protein
VDGTASRREREGAMNIDDKTIRRLVYDPPASLVNALREPPPVQRKYEWEPPPVQRKYEWEPRVVRANLIQFLRVARIIIKMERT